MRVLTLGLAALLGACNGATVVNSDDTAAPPTEEIGSSASDAEDGDDSAAPADDGIDQDCDGTADDNAVDASTYYFDADLDGYGDATSRATDCSAPSGYISGIQIRTVTR